APLLAVCPHSGGIKAAGRLMARKAGVGRRGGQPGLGLGIGIGPRSDSLEGPPSPVRVPAREGSQPFSDAAREWTLRPSATVTQTNERLHDPISSHSVLRG